MDRHPFGLRAGMIPMLVRPPLLGPDPGRAPAPGAERAPARRVDRRRGGTAIKRANHRVSRPATVPIAAAAPTFSTSPVPTMRPFTNAFDIAVTVSGALSWLVTRRRAVISVVAVVAEPPGAIFAQTLEILPRTVAFVAEHTWRRVDDRGGLGGNSGCRDWGGRSGCTRDQPKHQHPRQKRLRHAILQPGAARSPGLHIVVTNQHARRITRPADNERAMNGGSPTSVAGMEDDLTIVADGLATWRGGDWPCVSSVPASPLWLPWLRRS
jgi:hypothetical protein